MHTLADPRLSAVSIAHPLVSVIITNYNYGKYIAACLAGLAAQTYAHWECFVVDDVSTDNSMQLVEDFLQGHPLRERFTLLRRTANGGQMEAFRDGLARARGTFCMMLDADDVLLPDFLETHVRHHLGRKAVAFTSSNQYQIDGAGQVISGDHPDHLGKGRLRYVAEATFQKGFWIWATSSSMVFRRETLQLIMPAPGVTFRICADYYIAHFAQLLGNSLLIPTIHGCYRRHGENNFGDNPVIGAVNSVGCLDRHPPHDDFRRVMMQHLLQNYARFYRIYMEKGVASLLYRIATLQELKQLVREHGEILRRPMWWYVRHYLEFHARRWRRKRTPWKHKLPVVPEGFLFRGEGNNPFP